MVLHGSRSGALWLVNYSNMKPASGAVALALRLGAANRLPSKASSQG